MVTFDPAQHLSRWLAVMSLFSCFVLLGGIIFKNVLSRGTVCFETLLKLFYILKCTAFVFIISLCVVAFNPAEQYLVSLGWPVISGGSLLLNLKKVVLVT